MAWEWGLTLVLIDGIVSGVNGSLGIMASSLVFALLLMGFSPS